jgi:hypothetical protein
MQLGYEDGLSSVAGGNVTGANPQDERTSVLDDLTRVGPDKALGYLPLQTISRVLGLNVEDVIANERSRGLAALLLGPERCCINSGALYVYDPVALDAILRSSRSMLERAGFPTSAEPFIRTIAREWLNSDHPLMPLVKAAFADDAQLAMVRNHSE